MSEPRQLLFSDLTHPAPALRIDAVYDHSGRDDCYTPGGLFKVTGIGFGNFAEVPPGFGLYLVVDGSSAAPRAKRGRRSREAQPVQIFRYLRWTDTEIDGVWPVGPKGAQKLIVEIRAADGVPYGAAYERPLLP
jgi:hypothetical protein